MISKFAIWRKTQTVPILGLDGAGKTSVLSLLSKGRYEDRGSTNGVQIEATVKMNHHTVEFATWPNSEKERNSPNIKQDSPQGIILVVAFGFYPALPAGPFPDIDLSERLVRGTQAEIEFLEDEFDKYLQALDKHSLRDLEWVLSIVNKADLWWDRKNSVETFYRKRFQRVLLTVLRRHERTKTAMPITKFLSCRTQSFLDVADPSIRFDDDEGWRLRDELNNTLLEALDHSVQPDRQETSAEDSEKPAEKAEERSTLQCVSAKIALVGESNVGKSCLAMRLAEDRYPEDVEMGATFGMRFWPMDAEELHPAVRTPKGQRRDVVLWDFGGQDEYQLVHQMFLQDTTLALVLIDPTRGRAAMDEARDWNKRLEYHLGKDQRVKLLVGTKVEKKRDLIDQNSIDALCKECGFAEFIDVSAKTGRNIKKLRKLIAEALDWEQMVTTSRSELFQHIRDEIERRRRRGEIVLTLDAFKRAIKRSAAKLYEEAAVDAVSDQLATQGIIVRTRLTGGDEALVLQLPVIERYAGSLIIAARNNPRGVPVLEERLLSSTKTIPLPGMTKKERLSPTKERMVLECIVELMIQHGICFRHGGLLVFPTLFPVGQAVPDDDGGLRQAQPDLPFSVSLYYDFTGAIDNIYASLVSKLMVSEEFGEGRLRSGRVEYDKPGQGVCGIRQLKRTGGLAHIDLFFAEETKPIRRDLFTRFVEEHLRTNGVEIREHEAIKCRKCDREISEDIVQANIAANEKDVVCPWCRTHTLISEGVARIRERDPDSDARILALRKTIDARIARDAESVKKVVAKGADVTRLDEPIRLLHLSDLHFNAETEPRTKLQWLINDLEKGMKIDNLEYLVLSGDVTDKGNDEGFDKGREFVELLIDRFGLSAQRCIFVPGNHDVQDTLDAYARRRSVDDLPEDQVVRQGQIHMARDPKQYLKRLQKFSDAFYHKVVQLPYPLEVDRQGQAWLFEETGIQFLALNSAWQIDEFNRRRSGIAPAAVAHAIESADRQINAAKERGDLKRNAEVLKIAVWHHAVAGPEMMKDIDFIGNLQKNEVKLCLHGDVHEMRVDLVGYKTGHEMQIVGAGSFGSPPEGRPESTPRLYNLLEIERDFAHIRVHTRQQPKPNGAWKGWNEWPMPDGGKGRLPYLDIDLSY